MGYCKNECPDGETTCCICCDKQGGCDNRCDMMDSYGYRRKTVAVLYERMRLLGVWEE